MYSGSGFVTRVLPMDDERHGDMLPRTTSLVFPCTFGTDASTPRAALTLCYEHADIDGADGHADGRMDTRVPSMPASLRRVIPGAMTEHGIKVLLVEDAPSDGII